MKVAVFGGRGGGEIVAQSIGRMSKAGVAIELIGYLNDAIPAGERLLGASVVGPFAGWNSLGKDVLFSAPLHKVKEMQDRLQRVDALKLPAERWATLTDPGTAIAENARIGGGSVLCCFAVVGPSAVIGRHVAMWPGAQIGHDVEVGDFVFVGRNSIVSGYCKIGTGAFLGSGSVIRERVQIGRFATVGAGSTVVSDVADHAIVAGRPARVIGTTRTDGPA